MSKRDADYNVMSYIKLAIKLAIKLLLTCHKALKKMLESAPASFMIKTINVINKALG